jgi:hypothetical protein
MVSSRENFDLAAIASRPDSALDETDRNIVLALLEDRSLFQSTIESQIQIITNLHKETQNKVTNEIKRAKSNLLRAIKSARTEAIYNTTEVVNEAAVKDRIP